MSQIYNSLMKAERERKKSPDEKPLSQILEPEKKKIERESVIPFPQERVEAPKAPEGQHEKDLLDDQNLRTPLQFFIKLANSIKTNLGVLQTLTELSRGKFKDTEFENHFIEMVKEYIHGTDSGLHCFFDYLKIRSPKRKKNTIHEIIDDLLDGNEKRFRERKIQIVKKQFEKDLPETSMPYDHLKYVLNWVVQYASSFISWNGSIGFLTRSLDLKDIKENAGPFSKQDRKYIEVVIFCMVREGPKETPELKLGTKGLAKESDFIFPLIEEIVRMDRGIIRMNEDPNRQWKQISFILPAS